MTTASVAWALAVAAGIASGLVNVRRFAPPVWVSIGIALFARVVFAAVTSQRYTPGDVRKYFRQTGQLVLDGKDPLVHLPGREWNFLQFMPYVHALEIKTGLPWVYAVKIAPIACDALIVWLIYLLAGDRGRNRALQYAVNPVSLFVASLHGQVEPVALALALAGILLARRERWFLAGLLLGAAVAAKTWPVLIALAVIPVTRPRKLARLVVGGAVVPVAMLLSGVLFLDTRVVDDLRHIASYSSYVDNWGWAGVLVTAGQRGVGGYGSSVARLGSALTAAAAIAALIVFRRYSTEARALAVLCAALIATAGFGTQYLLWPLPLMLVVGRRAYVGYVLVATAFLGISYLARWPRGHAQFFTAGLSWLVIAALAAVIWDAWREGQARDTGRQTAVDDAGPRQAVVVDSQLD